MKCGLQISEMLLHMPPYLFWFLYNRWLYFDELSLTKQICNGDRFLICSECKFLSKYYENSKCLILTCSY